MSLIVSTFLSYAENDQKLSAEIDQFLIENLGEYMTELLLSMNLLIQNEGPPVVQWILPNEELDYELVEWHIMEKCLGRMEMLSMEFNCMDKSNEIFDSNSCNSKGNLIFY